MASTIRSLAFILLGVSIVTTGAVETQGTALRHRALRTGPVDCLLYELHALYPPGVTPPPGGDHGWVCEEDHMTKYNINLPDSYFKRMGAKSGHTRMKVSNAIRSPGTQNSPPTMSIASNVVPEFIPDDPNARRKLIPTIGTFTTLVARVSSLDDEPNRSAQTISGDIFSDELNFAKLMADCSADKAQYVPATGDDIVGGVTEIYLFDNTAGMPRGTAESLALDEIFSKYTLDDFDALIIILPFNVNFFGAAAYAYIDSILSVYHDENGSSPGILIHEVGHNMGLGHSGDTYDGEYYEYFDWTCQMGNGAAFANGDTGVLSDFGDDFGAYCFNGPKSWYLGWYDDRVEELSPTSSAWSGNLAGVDAYVRGDTTANVDYVVIKIPVASSVEDFYMMYNKREGITADVRDYQNRVVIWNAEGHYVASKVSTSLSAGGIYSVQNFDGTSRTLRIEVCSIDSVARVIVYLEGLNTASCNTNSPVTSPTDSPVQSPSDSPVRSPTDSPIRSPTDSPVQSPTDSPVQSPTDSPVQSPTDSPVQSPTDSPVRSPTDSPVTSPTDSPVRNPTPNDSPTQSPVKSGTKSPVSPTFSPTTSPTPPKPTPSPTRIEAEPGPSPRPPSGGGCFSENNTVEVKGKGPVPMDQLTIGDEVRVGNGGFSRVYSFGHKDPSIRDLHIAIYHSSGNGQPLELTPSHMVFVSGRGAVTADKVNVGDKLLSVESEEIFVTSISTQYSRGLYAPFTFSGDIVVSGVVASNYIAYLGSTMNDHHWLNHAYLTPLRFRCHFDPEYCSSESYEDGGVSDLYRPSMRLLENAKSLGDWTHFALSGLVSPALYSFQMLENMTDKVYSSLR